MRQRSRSNPKPEIGQRKRPALAAVSEQMKAWSAALAEEVSSWPQIEVRAFFGFTALYRKDQMFAALPRTRAMQSSNTLVFKLANLSPRLRDRLERDPRIGSMNMRKARWFTFELASDTDLHDALDWLGQAYDAAAKKSGRPK
jgi:hypothetical protein